MTGLSLLAVLCGPAHAADTWLEVRPGVELLHRTTADPQDIWAVRADLSIPEVALHASADAPGVERGVGTVTFAQNTGALVAINTDWSDGFTPVGLAVSNGWKWHDHIPDDTLGGHWGYVGCPLDKRCTLSRELPLDQAWWFTDPLRAPYRFHHATGANGIVMIANGVAGSGCYDAVRNPRSALCVESDGLHMWFVVVDGRRADALGMTCDETRTLLLDLGCHDAVMLDGGGSSTLVVEGAAVNRPSDGSPRTVSNHLGLLYHGPPDPRCVVANGAFCVDDTLSHCQGGALTGTGDCSFFGATCQEDGDFAFCVDYRCPEGDGLGATCLDATRIASCNDGAYGEGDCAAFGLVCGEDAEGAGCMDARCEAGPHSSFCTSDGELAWCTGGLYEASACDAGTTCAPTGDGAVCADDRCPSADGGACVEDTWVSCSDGQYSELDCHAAGERCDAAADGCVPPVDPGAPPTDERADGCGCASDSGPGAAALVMLLVVVVSRRLGPYPA